MNGQQMVEHLSDILKISNGNRKIDVFVEDEKAKRRKPFLDSENEIEPGFKPSLLSDEPRALKYAAMQEAIDDLLQQILDFEKMYTDNSSKTIVHPFFGDLDFEYWKKFHVKHFTHHFKQFGLI